jgi:hypothetical protein
LPYQDLDRPEFAGESAAEPLGRVLSLRGSEAQVGQRWRGAALGQKGRPDEFAIGREGATVKSQPPAGAGARFDKIRPQILKR